jgi:surface carbohydrate biosynthesis protein
MPKPIDIVILYEKALRELDVACALKVMLERQGLSVEIIHQDHDYGEALKHYRPRMVVLPFCYQNRSNNIYLMRWRDAIFVNLTWEQFFYRGNRKAKTPRGEFPIGHVIHFAWSRDYLDMLTEIGVPPERTFLSGNPALGLYRPPYRNYFKSRAELATAYGLDPGRRWIFFPENYNWAFYDESMLQQMVVDGQSRADVDSMRAFATCSFGMAMEWCRRLVAETDVELILRPRPATISTHMRTRVEELVGQLPERFHILQEETVREWILASDLVVSSYSTSMIEAAVAGRSILMLEPLPLPESLVQAWHHLAPRARDYEQLKQLANEPAVKSSEVLAAWAEANLLGDGDPLRAITDCLSSLCHGEALPPPTATRASVTWGCPVGVPLLAWWGWKYLRSFVSQFKALFNIRHVPADNIIPDVAAKHSITFRCTHWKNCLPQ